MYHFYNILFFFFSNCRFCDTRPLPSRSRVCIIPQDCVVSEWSEWVIEQDGCIDYTGKARENYSYELIFDFIKIFRYFLLYFETDLRW